MYPASTAPQRRTAGCRAYCKYKLAARASALQPAEGAGRIPSFDYVGRLRNYKYGQGNCPLLFLAPMENLADRTFRRAFASTIGGFDEACTEFLRIPGRSENPMGSIRGVISPARYDPQELGPGLPLGAQLMGSTPELMGLAAGYLARVRGAPRVDLNCGCPANTVTGSGAGSSLLRTPRLLGQVVAAMVAGAGNTPVSVKLRAGFDDPGLLRDNLLAAQEAGAAFVTLHPRTRRQAYSGWADWALIARAVELLDIPVVGNGDVVSVDRAHQLLRETGCHGLMVGRGAVHDPLIFLRIRHSFGAGGAAASGPEDWQLREPELVQDLLWAYAGQLMPGLAVRGSGGGTALAAAETRRTWTRQRECGGLVNGSIQSLHVVASLGPGSRGRELEPGLSVSENGEDWGCGGAPEAAEGASASGRQRRGADGDDSGVAAAGAAKTFGRLKVVMRYLFASSPQLAAAAEGLLRRTPANCSAEELVWRLCEEAGKGWPRSGGGPTRRVLYDHMSKEVREVRELVTV